MTPTTTRAPRLIAYSLIAITVIFLTLVLIIPLLSVFYYALHQGLDVYLASLNNSDARRAITLTLTLAAIVAPINLIAGIAIAWLLTRYDFRGKTFFSTLLDLPFAISPVIAGLMLVLLFGSGSLIGGLFESQGIRIIYALPGMVLATLFVTFPFVARELIPLMQSMGSEEEQAALLLGASPWQIFWRITLPNIRWTLFYGLILANARAMGEFGAVSIVSGHIRGQTNTMPLAIEILYNEYQFSAAFALSSLLALLSIITLIAQNILERKQPSISE